MRLPKVLTRGLTAAATLSMLALAIPAAPLAAQTVAPAPDTIKADPKNCSLVDQGRYGAVGKNVCDDKTLMTMGPAENIVITIDDTGFHPREARVGQGGGLTGVVTFVNLGTRVHTATQLPSSPMWGGVMAVGGVNVNGWGGGKGGRQGTRDQFDTGGITPNPGGTVQSSIQMGTGNGVAYLGVAVNGDFVYSSYPDCIAADRVNTGFDCTPAVLHVVDNQEGTKELQKVLGYSKDPTTGRPTVVKLGSGAAVGTVLRPVGDKDCAMLAQNAPILAPGRNNTACISAVRTNEFQKAPAGSNAKPYTSDPNITIDDIYGFDPASITIAIQTPMTFTNKKTSLLVHSVTIKPSNSRPISLGDIQLNGPGLAPGDTWTFAGPQFVPDGSLGWQSDTEQDLLDASLNGLAINGKQQPIFLGKATVICAPGSFTPLSVDQIRGLGQPCAAQQPGQDPAVLSAGTIQDF